MSKKKAKTPWVDYKSLKAQVGVLDVLIHYGVELNTTNGDQYYGSCPLPNHGGDRTNKQAFSVSQEKNCWRCHTHCGSGNSIEVYALMSGRDPEDKGEFREAAVEMAQTFAGGEVLSADDVKPKATRAPAKEPEPAHNEPLDFALQLKADHPFLLKEKGFSPEIIEEFGLGWCSKGMQAGRIVVPIHNGEGELIAYAGRGLKENDINKRGRWLLPKGFAKRIVVFNEHRALDQLREFPDAPLVVVEGFWSAIRLYEAGFAAVALMGADMSDEQCQRIWLLSDNVHLFLDDDDTGRAATPKIAASLARHVSLRLVCYDDGDERHQPEDFSPEELKKLIQA